MSDFFAPKCKIDKVVVCGQLSDWQGGTRSAIDRLACNPCQCSDRIQSEL